LFGGDEDSIDLVTKEDVRSFISAYQQLLAEQELMLSANGQTTYQCVVQIADDEYTPYKFWSGFGRADDAICHKVDDPGNNICLPGDTKENPPCILMRLRIKNSTLTMTTILKRS